MKAILWTIVVILIVSIVGGYGFMVSGIYDVAATSPPSSFERWAANVVRKHSTESRAGGVPEPDLSDSTLIATGYRAYDGACIGCHRAPGLDSSPTERGLNPSPPHLWSHEAQAADNQELFWIIKHGFRMTGMPAFGPTHDDQQIWALVAVIRQLPNLQPGQYQVEVERAKGGGSEAASATRPGFSGESGPRPDPVCPDPR